MSAKTPRKRLDVLLVERGLAESRQKAQAMILAGEVEVAGEKADKAGLPVEEAAAIQVRSRLQKYVSRGGFKLEGALQDSKVDAKGRVCLDVGSGGRERPRLPGRGLLDRRLYRLFAAKRCHARLCHRREHRPIGLETAR